MGRRRLIGLGIVLALPVAGGAGIALAVVPENMISERTYARVVERMPLAEVEALFGR